MTYDGRMNAEQLWSRAHEQVKRGDFASAVRDLAQCFQMLQAAKDPRVYEVHKRWTEVHQMYLEDGQRQSQPPAEKAPSVEAEAEAAANAGDLDRAIALYGEAGQTELVKERVAELNQAKKRAAELSGKPAPAEDDWSEVSVENTPSPVQPSKAPTMAVEDAPIGMQSLDVPFSVGPAIDSFQADELPLEGRTSAPPKPVASAPAAELAFLEELLVRVASNRRA